MGNSERLKRLMTNMVVKEEVNVIKSDNISSPLINTEENNSINNIPLVDSSVSMNEPVSINNSSSILNESQVNLNNKVPLPNLDPLPVEESNSVVVKEQPVSESGNKGKMPPILEVSDAPPSVSEPEVKSSFSLNSLYPNMNKSSKVVDEVVDNSKSELLEKPSNESELKIGEKSPRKDVVIVQNENDIDETSSLANFFQDMKQIVEDKGIKIETNTENNYSLFEDASEVEK